MTMRAINRLKIIDLTKDEDCSRTKKNRVLRVIFDVSRNEIPFERILAKCRKTRPGLEITFRLWMNVVTTEWEIALSSLFLPETIRRCFPIFRRQFIKNVSMVSNLLVFLCRIHLLLLFFCSLHKMPLLGLFISEYLPFCVWQCEKQYEEREFYLFPWKNASRMQFLLALFPAFVSSSFTIGT